MKFDKRNPFAAWGFEQEVVTVSDNATKGFAGSMAGTANTLYVNDNVHPATAGKFTTPQTESFFTNNDNTVETLYTGKRMVPEQDLERQLGANYNNAELNYYGIEAQDLMADTKAHHIITEAEADSINEALDNRKVKAGAIDPATATPDEIAADKDANNEISEEEKTEYNDSLEAQKVTKGDVLAE